MSKYAELGVDVHKKGIEAFKDTSGIYKHAFCSIHPYPGEPGFGFVHHADGAGSKPVQNYLNWKETGDIEAFRGIAQDALAMNIGDALCVGVPIHGSFVDYVAVNGLHAPKKEILGILAEDWSEQFRMLRNYGIDITFSGGETADLPDQMRTLDVAGTIHAKYDLKSVITGERIKPGDVIVGVESGGQAIYESKPSGAIMCNGLTLARHCLMDKKFGENYPEILEPGKGYTGIFAPTDKVEGIQGTIGEEITRPTRIFAPIFKGVINEFGKDVHGVVFDTGGGSTKCLRVGRNIKYVKDSMPEPPKIFKLIKDQGKVSGREMYMDFNMGVGADLFVDSDVAREVSNFIKGFGIKASEIGCCGKSAGQNNLELHTHYGSFLYS